MVPLTLCMKDGCGIAGGAGALCGIKPPLITHAPGLGTVGYVPNTKHAPGLGTAPTGGGFTAGPAGGMFTDPAPMVEDAGMVGMGIGGTCPCPCPDDGAEELPRNAGGM